MSWKDDIIKPDRNYKVVIRCSTYNQEKYIEDALKGFVRQKTNFPFCAVVVDDCSTDGNAEIIRRYERQYPDIIKGIYLQENMFHNPEKGTFVRPWMQAGEYNAICEGDDYWIDEHKLQRQVDYLDAHPECSLVFHNALVKYDNHNHPDHLISQFETGYFTPEKIFEKWQLPLASVVYRRSLVTSPLYRNLIKVFAGGFCLFITASMENKAYGISECLSVYRINDHGISNGMSAAYCMKLNEGFAKVTGNKKVIAVQRKKSRKMMYTALANLRHGRNVAENKAVLAQGWQINHGFLFTSILRYPLVVLGLKINQLVSYVCR